MVYFIDIDSSQTDSYYKYYVSDKMDVFTISFDYESNRMDQIKCCAFSYDLKYVAVGMDTGLISASFKKLIQCKIKIKISIFNDFIVFIFTF